MRCYAYLALFFCTLSIFNFAQHQHISSLHLCISRHPFTFLNSNLHHAALSFGYQQPTSLAPLLTSQTDKLLAQDIISLQKFKYHDLRQLS